MKIHWRCLFVCLFLLQHRSAHSLRSAQPRFQWPLYPPNAFLTKIKIVSDLIIKRSIFNSWLKNRFVLIFSLTSGLLLYTNDYQYFCRCNHVLVHRQNEYFADSNYESGACLGPVSDHLISSHPNGEHFGR